MRYRAVLHFVAIIAVLLILWGISINSSGIHKKARHLLWINIVNQSETKLKLTTSAPVPKCNLSRACPPDTFALHIMSGAANVVGPKICFDGKIIMSHVLNNVEPGLNIVVINGDKGVVEKIGYLNTPAGKPNDMLAYLRTIDPGLIVVAASYDDMTTKMTDETREMFVGMGSALIKSVKLRDNWVFAGRVNAGNKSSFEKLAVNDKKNNPFEEWPGRLEVGGCFPRGSGSQEP